MLMPVDFLELKHGHAGIPRDSNPNFDWLISVLHHFFICRSRHDTFDWMDSLPHCIFNQGKSNVHKLSETGRIANTIELQMKREGILINRFL